MDTSGHVVIIYKGSVVVPLCLNISADHFPVSKPELDIIVKIQIR